MIFRNIVFSAVIVGMLAGLFYGLFQQLKISPIIINAEVYEVVKENVSNPENDHSHEGAAHSHNEDAWQPKEGSERMLYTLLSSLLSGISFALIMITLMALHNHKSAKPKVNTVRGIIWGIAGMLAVFVAPAMFGLYPEIPGTEAAVLEYRQIWWTLCVLATAVGIAILYYAPLKIKILGVIVAAMPHVIGPPMPDQHGFANPDPFAINMLTQLSQEFYLMTAVGMAIFFILIGAFSGYAVKKYVRLEA